MLLSIYIYIYTYIGIRMRVSPLYSQKKMELRQITCLLEYSFLSLFVLLLLVFHVIVQLTIFVEFGLMHHVAKTFCHSAVMQLHSTYIVAQANLHGYKKIESA